MNTLCYIVMSYGLLISTSVSALTDSEDNLFQACVKEKGTSYIIAISNYLSSAGEATNLVELASNISAPMETRLVAHILLARLESGKHFDAFREYIQIIRVRSDAKCERVGYLSGQILAFTKLGHESRMSWERSGEQYVGVMKAPRFEKVEKYTQQDVELGTKRNRAMRMAVAESFLKLSDSFSNYEINEFLSVLGEIRDYYRKQSETSYSDLIQDLIISILSDAKRPLPVRIDAVYKLPPDKWNKQIVSELMLKALQEYKSDNIQEYQNTIYAACDYLKHFGNSEDLKIMRNIKSEKSEAKKQINETIRELEVRLEK